MRRFPNYFVSVIAGGMNQAVESSQTNRTEAISSSQDNAAILSNVAFFTFSYGLG